MKPVNTTSFLKAAFLLGAGHTPLSVEKQPTGGAVFTFHPDAVRDAREFDQIKSQYFHAPRRTQEVQAP